MDFYRNLMNCGCTTRIHFLASIKFQSRHASDNAQCFEKKKQEKTVGLWKTRGTINERPSVEQNDNHCITAARKSVVHHRDYIADDITLS